MFVMVWPNYWALVQHLLLWPGGVVVRALDLRLWRLRVWLLSLRSHVTTLGKLLTCASVTKQCNLVPVKGRWCPAVGKVTVVLAMRHRLQWFIHLQAHGLRKGDEHSAYAPHGALPWSIHCFAGKTEDWSASPEAAEPAVWSRTPGEGDEQMFPVQVSHCHLQLLLVTLLSLQS